MLIQSSQDSEIHMPHRHTATLPDTNITRHESNSSNPFQEPSMISLCVLGLQYRQLIVMTSNPKTEMFYFLGRATGPNFTKTEANKDKHTDLWVQCQSWEQWFRWVHQLDSVLYVFPILEQRRDNVKSQRHVPYKLQQETYNCGVL